MVKRLLSTIILLLLLVFGIHANVNGQEAIGDDTTHENERLSKSKEDADFLAEAERLDDELENLFNERKFKEALPLADRRLVIIKQLRGENHLEYAECLSNLAVLHTSLGTHAKAVPLFTQALQIQKMLLGEGHSALRNNLYNLGHTYMALGDSAKAAESYQDAINIQKKILGEDHIGHADSIEQLATAFTLSGNYAKAEVLYKRSIAIRKKVSGAQHRQSASSLNNMAALYFKMGEYAKAEHTYMRGLEISKENHGEQHPLTALILGSLASLHSELGDYAKAEPLGKQGLEINKQIVGEQHGDTARSLNNLAQIYRAMGDFLKAQPLAEQSLEINRKVLGERHPRTRGAASTLAGVYFLMGDYSKAEAPLRRTLDLLIEIEGEQHPGTAIALNDLACLYFAMGDYAKAEPLYAQSLNIKSKVLSERHLAAAITHSNLGRLYLLMDNFAKAEPHLRQAINANQVNLKLASAVQSQRQQLAMSKLLRNPLDGYVQLAVKANGRTETVYRQILAWKGAVLIRQQAMRAARSPELTPLVNKLQSVAARLAHLAFSTPEPKQFDTRGRQLAELSEEKERLERELSGKSATYLEASKTIGLEELCEELPEGSALVDFLEYSHTAKNESGRATFNPELAAFVISKQTPVQIIQLGPAGELATAITTWRTDYGQSKKSRAAGKLLRERIWEPIEPYLSTARLVMLSPDGVLNRLPFAALPGRSPDTYLIEDYALAVIPVPQLLPRLLTKATDEDQATSTSDQVPLLLVGDVAFDDRPTAHPDEVQLAGLSRTAARGNTAQTFTPLPGTRQEVDAIQQLYAAMHNDQKPVVLRGIEASEVTLAAHAPMSRYVHIATHGFFAPESVKSALGSSSEHERLLPFSEQQQKVTGFHPGLLSGLALAGANRKAQQTGLTSDRTDDGILTAMEIEALDLSKVDLAVLSACETGLGKVAGGEGILGLQRAFQVAGANTTITSLWRVDDAVTRDLMIRFYENLWQKKLPKLEALRQAQLSILNGETRESELRGPTDTTVARTDDDQSQRTSPRLWAAWVLSGDPGELTLSTPAAPVSQAVAVDDVVEQHKQNQEQPSQRKAIYATATLFVLALAVMIFLRLRRQP